MSGLLSSFKEGNRSELLADYLLSAIGITTPVRRQDDHGIDFYCQIADNETGYMTFGYPFMLQIKSKAKKNVIAYGKKKGWRPENTTWLFRNEIPFFIGIVDKRTSTIEIYDTTGLWQVYNYNHEDCSRIELVPKKREWNVERKNCEPVLIQNWRAGNGDGYKYEVDLGNPIISLNHQDILDTNILRDRKIILRKIIELEQRNILYRKQHVRAFIEVKNNTVNNMMYRTGAKFEARVTDNPDNIYDAIREALILQLYTLNILERPEVNNLKELLKYVPYAHYYKQLWDALPGDPIYDWMDPTKFED